eukprot:5809333-Amphidinium_carterae.1
MQHPQDLNCNAFRLEAQVSSTATAPMSCGDNLSHYLLAVRKRSQRTKHLRYVLSLVPLLAPATCAVSGLDAFASSWE